MVNTLDLLVVEDDAVDFERLNGMLGSLDGYRCQVTWASTHRQARALVNARRFDALLLDYWLDGGRTSLELLNGMGKINGLTPAIIVTGSEDHDHEAVLAGVVDYVSKDRLDRVALERTLRHAIDRKQVERQLRDSEQRFRGLVDAISEMVWTAEPDGTIKDCRAFAEYTGMSPQMMAREGWVAAIHPQDVPMVTARWRQSMQEGATYEVVLRMRRRDGVYRWFWGHSIALRNDDGTVREWIGIALDIEEQRQNEDALTRSNHRLREVIRTQQEIAEVATNRMEIKRRVAERVRGLVGADIVAVARVLESEFEYPTLVGDVDEAPLRVPAEGSLTGWCAATRRSVRCDDLELDPRGDRAVGARFSTRSALYVPLVSSDEVIGVLTAMSRTVAAFTDEDLHTLELLAGILASALANARAYEERLASEGALAFQAQLLQSVQQAVVATDMDGRITYWNPYAEQQFGWTAAEATGRLARELIVPADCRDESARIRSRVENGESFIGDYELQRRDGTRFTALTSNTVVRGADGRAVGFIGVSRDVMKERELEEQLRHSQKLQAVGQLAGGVAHDFNNILTAITSYAELAHDAATDPALQADVEEIRRAARRGADLTRQMLAFSRKQVLQPAAFDAAAVILDMENMLRRVLSAEIEFVVTVRDRPLPLYADRSQLEQVLLNLVVNARDAITGAGRIVVEVSALSDQIMSVEVSDTGSGMPESVIARMFEPFFTTKPAGKGTGLGLSVVHGIVRQMQGTIDVDSAPGRGTRFTISLPLVAMETAPAAVAPATTSVRRSGETILLVEDNPALLALCQRVLQKAGYSVLGADTPEAALAAARGSRVSLVITDVIMPEMDGATLVERLADDGVTAPVIFMSGYTEDVAIKDGRARDRSTFLAKPFAPADLTRTVRDLLDAHAAC